MGTLGKSLQYCDPSYKRKGSLGNGGALNNAKFKEVVKPEKPAVDVLVELDDISMRTAAPLQWQALRHTACTGRSTR